MFRLSRALTGAHSRCSMTRSLLASSLAPLVAIERVMYGWSVTHCLPTQLVEPDSAATGTVLRAETVSAFAASAGFGRTTELSVHNDFFRLYRLDR